MRALAIGALALLGLVLADQASKAWVEAVLPYAQPVPVVPFFSLFRTYNTGVAFSLLSGAGPWPLVALTIVICGFIAFLWWRTPAGRWLSHAGFALILGGALGNLIDRVRFGHVVDFALVHTDAWSFAVFNLADAFITVGAACIIVDEFVGPRLGSSPKETS